MSVTSFHINFETDGQIQSIFSFEYMNLKYPRYWEVLDMILFINVSSKCTVFFIVLVTYLIFRIRVNNHISTTNLSSPDSTEINVKLM